MESKCIKIRLYGDFPSENKKVKLADENNQADINRKEMMNWTNKHGNAKERKRTQREKVTVQANHAKYIAHLSSQNIAKPCMQSLVVS